LLHFLTTGLINKLVGIWSLSYKMLQFICTCRRHLVYCTGILERETVFNRIDVEEKQLGLERNNTVFLTVYPMLTKLNVTMTSQSHRRKMLM